MVGRWIAMRRLLLSCTWLLMLAVACTGTREAPTPAFLVVADGSTIGLVASPLPPDEVSGSGTLEWLGEFERELPGPVTGLAVARDLPTRVFVAYRDDGSDHVQRFRAEAVRAGAPETFEASGDPIDVGDIVTTALEVEPCVRALRASSNGRWLALLHQPAACPEGTAGAGAAVFLLDLEAGPPAEMVAFPDVASREDAATPPLFVPPPGGSEPGALLYLEVDGTLIRLSLPEDGEVEEARSQPLGPIEPVGLGSGGLGVVIAEDDAVHSFGTDSVGEPVELVAEPGLRAVIDAGSLPNATAVLRSESGLIVRTGVGSEDPADAGELPISGLVDATVGPYGYAFALAPGGITVVDLLTYAGTAAGSETDPLARFQVPNVGGSDVSFGSPVAIEWIFGAVPTADP